MKTSVHTDIRPLNMYALQGAYEYEISSLVSPSMYNYLSLALTIMLLVV